MPLQVRQLVRELLAVELLFYLALEVVDDLELVPLLGNGVSELMVETGQIEDLLAWVWGSWNYHRGPRVQWATFHDLASLA